MAKLEGKLPFVGAVYKSRIDGEKIKVTARERDNRDGSTMIYSQTEKTGSVVITHSDVFYEQFKRCKDGTAFHIEEGWNE